MKVLICTLIISYSLFCPIASHADDPGDVVLIRADHWTIKQSDLLSLLKMLSPGKAQALKEDPVKLKRYVKRLAETKALAEYAKKQGFLNRPEVKAELDRMMNEIIAQLYIKDSLKDIGNDITDKDLKLYYRGNKKNYRLSDQVKLRVIKFPVGKYATNETIRKIFDKVQTIKQELKQGKKFPELAQTYNVIPELKDKAGELGWVKVDTLTPDLARIINHTKKGQYFGPIRTGKGVYFGVVEGRKKGKYIPFSQVKEEIRTKLLEEKKKNAALAILKNAMNAEGVTINSEGLLEIFSGD